MAHLDPRDDLGQSMGWLDGKVVFRSHNLRGLVEYGRKHGITLAVLGEGPKPYKEGLCDVTFGNGATSRGTFASPTVMLNFFLARRSVATIECERTIVNQGFYIGRTYMGFYMVLPRDSTTRLPGWDATTYRCPQHVPMVRFERQN